MSFPSLKIGDLVAKTPIVQGGMGVGISLSRLASAVANEGGIGVIAGAMIGMKEPDVASNPLEANLRALRREIEKAREAGKPEAMLERIAEGTVKKFLKEVTLVNQPFVKDDKKSVGELVKAAGAQIGGYTLFVVGEGIEKRVDDFAAEVAAQVAAAKA